MIDEPIIVTGGSVKVAISEKFKDDGKDKGKKKYKLDDQKLHSLWVNGEKVRDLSQTDTVSIRCDDGTTG